MIFSESDVCDLLMQGRDPAMLDHMIVDDSVQLDQWPDLINPVPQLKQQRMHSCTVPEFHQAQQRNWHMPQDYKDMDIAAHVLSLCDDQAQLQRCGHELLMYQERNLFDLLKYLKYLVDVMTANHVIWGVGRGSSVASYVLYKLGVHRIDSMYYDLSPEEFLR